MKGNTTHHEDSKVENHPINQSTYPGYLRYPPRIEEDNEFTEEEALINIFTALDDKVFQRRIPFLDSTNPFVPYAELVDKHNSVDSEDKDN